MAPEHPPGGNGARSGCAALPRRHTAHWAHTGLLVPPRACSCLLVHALAPMIASRAHVPFSHPRAADISAPRVGPIGCAVHQTRMLISKWSSALLTAAFNSWREWVAEQRDEKKPLMEIAIKRFLVRRCACSAPAPRLLRACSGPPWGLWWRCPLVAMARMPWRSRRICVCVCVPRVCRMPRSPRRGARGTSCARRVRPRSAWARCSCIGTLPPRGARGGSRWCTGRLRRHANCHPIHSIATQSTQLPS